MKSLLEQIREIKAETKKAKQQAIVTQELAEQTYITTEYLACLQELNQE